MLYTRQQIENRLRQDARFVEHAILALFMQQTQIERERGETITKNGVGFRADCANRGSYIASWLLKGNRLSGRWVEDARKIALRHAGQLTDLANTRQQKPNTTQQTVA